MALSKIISECDKSNHYFFQLLHLQVMMEENEYALSMQIFKIMLKIQNLKSTKKIKLRQQ